MSLEFVGAIGTQSSSEYRPGKGGPVIDKTFVSAFARAHEYAGFDRVLIGYFSSAPDGFQVAAYAGQQTERLKFLLAHRPGFVAPTLAARQLATLDQFIDGRLAVHIITGGAEHEQARDGDFLDKATRYARTDDYRNPHHRPGFRQLRQRPAGLRDRSNQPRPKTRATVKGRQERRKT